MKNNINYKLKYLKYKLKYLKKKKKTNLIGGNNLNDLLNELIGNYLLDELILQENKDNRPILGPYDDPIKTKYYLADKDEKEKLIIKYDNIINFILPGMSVTTQQIAEDFLFVILQNLNINTKLDIYEYELYDKFLLNDIILLYKQLYIDNEEDGYNNFINNLISKNYIPDIDFNNVICNIDNNIICKSILRVDTSLDKFKYSLQEQLLEKIFINIYKKQIILCNKLYIAHNNIDNYITSIPPKIDKELNDINIEYSKEINSEYLMRIENIQDTNNLTIKYKIDSFSIPKNNSIIILKYYIDVDYTNNKNLLKTNIIYNIKSTINNIYDLKGIIWHLGNSPNSGHFITHIKTRDDWDLINDFKINPLHECIDYTKKPLLDIDININNMRPALLFYYKNDSMDYIDREVHGLSNPSNSCWFAAVMQNLIRMRPFMENINN